MAHQCTICYNDFTWDPSSKDKSQLPVQSRVCSHVLCYSCVISIYQATSHQYEDGEIISLPCPECRLKRAHDPFVPIVSLSLCDMLEERHQMVARNPELQLEQVSEDLRIERLERRQREAFHRKTVSEIVTEIAIEKAESLRRTVAEKLASERPLLRITREASRAVYWGSILMFGAIDRNEIHNNLQVNVVDYTSKSVETIWNKVTEKFEEPLNLNFEL